MFDKSYNKVHDPEDSNLKIGMQKSIVHLLTLLQTTSFTNLTTDTRQILSDTYEEMKQ